MDPARLTGFVDSCWERSALPQLTEYIRIPNKSPAFDPDWERNGHMERAVSLFMAWCHSQDVAGMHLEVVRLPGRTPLLFLEVPGRSPGTVLLYGHLDKQPEMTGWREGLGPWQPVVEDDRLYGRGGADDGYALFASLIAIQALADQRIPHARCVILIEACEESGSYDLGPYIDALADRIGEPDLVICLDSGCGNYEQLWNTTSLRGLVGGELRVDVLTEGVHSGDASGVVPSSFRILRELLGRVDNSRDGGISGREFNVAIPEQRRAQAQTAARVLGEEVYRRFPFTEGTRPVSEDPVELILNRTWRPALSITGIGGMPALDSAGNVLRPYTSVKLSLRLPPTCDAAVAGRALQQILETDPPHRARISYLPDWNTGGWHAPRLEAWLDAALDQASRTYFGKPAMHMGEGGTIPFMGMLGEKFPAAQFLITGVLGPHANAHGPNEFLHLPTARKLTCCVAGVLAEHFLARTG